MSVYGSEPRPRTKPPRSRHDGGLPSVCGGPPDRVDDSKNVQGLLGANERLGVTVHHINPVRDLSQPGIAWPLTFEPFAHGQPIPDAVHRWGIGHDSSLGAENHGRGPVVVHV